MLELAKFKPAILVKFAILRNFMFVLTTYFLEWAHFFIVKIMTKFVRFIVTCYVFFESPINIKMFFANITFQ